MALTQSCGDKGKMKNQFSYGHLIFFLFLLLFLLILIQLELLAFAFAKLNLPPMLGLLIFILSLFGSAINLPVFRIRSDEPQHHVPVPMGWHSCSKNSIPANAVKESDRARKRFLVRIHDDTEQLHAFVCQSLAHHLGKLLEKEISLSRVVT